MENNVSVKKAEWVCFLAIATICLFWVLTLSLSAWNGSESSYVLSCFYFNGLAVWVLSFLHIRQTRLSKEEEVAERELPVERNTLFDKNEIDPFSARTRLDNFEKWASPITTLLLAVFFVSLATFLFSKYWKQGIIEPDFSKAPLSAAFLGGFAFFSLLLSKYALGMAQQTNWRLLRAGGSYLFMCAVLSFLCAISLAISHASSNTLLTFTIIILIALIGIEMGVNLVLDIYRPRIKGQEVRPPYDSRFLELCTGSKGLLRTVAHTLDYQFGFQVSETWFYQFMEKAIAPLLLFQICTLYFLDCIVVVHAHEQAIIERFGVPSVEQTVLEPGLHFKWPWPIERDYRYPKERFYEVFIGSQHQKNEPEHGHQEQQHHIIFAKSHHSGEEEYFLIARDGKNYEGTMPVNLFVVNIVLRYEIINLYDYVYNHQNPQGLIEGIGYRLATQYFASVNIDGDGVLGANRLATANILKQQMQEECDRHHLGIQVSFLGILEVHPPSSIVPAYESTISAMEEKRRKILAANIYRESQLPKTQAEAKKIINEAKNFFFQQKELTQAESEMFEDYLKAYEEGKEVFLQRIYMKVLEERLKEQRLYINMSNSQRQSYVLELQEPLGMDLGNLGITEKEEQK